VGWTNISADTLITPKPALLNGVVILASSNGGRATLYDGQDAGSGRKIIQVEGDGDLSNPIMFFPPLRCERGIFVADLSHVDEILVLWSPLEV